MSSYTWAADRHDQVEAAVRDGLSAREIADRLGVKVDMVRKHVAALRHATGEPFTFARGRTRKARCDAELIAAHADGLRPSDIAQRFGWTVGYVHSLFCRLRRETGFPLVFDTTVQQAKIWGEHIREREGQVVTAFRDGLSAQQIADRLGVSLTTVRTFVGRLRRATGDPFAFDRSRNSAHGRMGRERRRLIAEAYAPGVTLDELATRTGLSARLVQQHLVRLRRDTGQRFPVRRRREGGGSQGRAARRGPNLSLQAKPGACSVAAGRAITRNLGSSERGCRDPPATFRSCRTEGIAP